MWICDIVVLVDSIALGHRVVCFACFEFELVDVGFDYGLWFFDCLFACECFDFVVCVYLLFVISGWLVWF